MKFSQMYFKALQIDHKKLVTFKKIKQCTKLTRNHLTPEIALHLITPDCTLWNAGVEQSPFQDPFWAFYWPGGQALSRYVLDNKKLFLGKTILDVGSGSGACAIAAAISGSKFVTANDIDQVSCAAVQMNSVENNVMVEVNANNLIGSECNGWDCLLVGDMFYDSEFGQDMFAWLKMLAKKNKLILVGDPGRHAFNEINETKEILKHVGKYDLLEYTCLENRGFKTANVWKFHN